MRSHPLRRLTVRPTRRAPLTPALVVAVGVGLLPAEGASQAERLEPTIDVALRLPETLQIGDRATLLAEVTISPAGSEPVLVTPSSTGPAIEVVRGRLLRADAEDPDARTLRFRIPLVARAAGDAVVRVDVSGYACAPRCTPVRGEAQVVARVARR